MYSLKTMNNYKINYWNYKAMIRVTNKLLNTKMMNLQK